MVDQSKGLIESVVYKLCSMLRSKRRRICVWCVRRKSASALEKEKVVIEFTPNRQRSYPLTAKDR